MPIAIERSVGRSVSVGSGFIGAVGCGGGAGSAIGGGGGPPGAGWPGGGCAAARPAVSDTASEAIDDMANPQVVLFMVCPSRPHRPVWPVGLDQSPDPVGDAALTYDLSGTAWVQSDAQSPSSVAQRSRCWSMQTMQGSVNGDLSNSVMHWPVQSCCAAGNGSAHPHSGAQARSASSATVCAQATSTTTQTITSRCMG